jgi:hypothetical protein
MAKCAQCGHRLPDKRLGVPLSALKARMFDLISHGGDVGGPGGSPNDDGISSDALYARVFGGRNSSRESMKAHIWQINEKLHGEGWRIVCVCNRYRLVRIKKRAA